MKQEKKQDVQRPAQAECTGSDLQHTENSTLCHVSELNQKAGPDYEVSGNLTFLSNK